ncbi:MATE family efflux transporter [Vallitalea longa]|uniref:Probable multidrug resistance protein NorM n=1 Tax=Vallitalea longa TaxID=2936439 RepID=A0A9W6DEI7_9FIRM|nr:MATE family efflux transporter [Vallitalea longa]GKX30226.1 MATE family efflux transporter [Vallitalea longa]
MENNSRQNKMGTMKISKLMFVMSGPAIIAMVVQALYNVVDSIFVARYSEDAFTAVSYAFPIQLIIIAFFVGLGIGINSLISRKLGEKDVETASNAAEHGLLMSLALYLIILLLGIFFANDFFEWFTKSKNIIELGTQYIQIIMFFSFGRLIAQAGMSILQGTGNMIHPMISQLIGAVINIILDPILIFGYFGLPEMGIRGAAIATVIGQILSMVYMLIVLYTKDHQVKLDFRSFKYDRNIIKGIMKVGLPAAVMQAIGSVMLIGLNLVLGSFGDVAVRVMGVYYKLQSFVFMPVFGLSQGIMPIVGYNYGAKNKERLMKAIKLGITAAIIYMSLGFLAFQIIPSQLFSLFNSSQEMVSIGVIAFRIISFIFPMAAISIMYSTSFQGMGKAHISMIVSIIRQLVVLLPCAFIFGKIFGLNGVWFSFITSEIAGLSVALISFKKVYKNQLSTW